MLGKLLKYEMKSVGRLFLILDAVVLILAVVTGAIFHGYADLEHIGIIAGVLFTLYMILIVALVIVTIIMIIQRFYKNMLGGEGYLMHTLPVPTWMHITVKVIAAFIWSVIASVVSVISCLLLLFIGFGDIEEIREMMNVFSEYVDISAGIAVLLVITMIVQLVRMLLCVYASMAVGGSAYKHKILFSFLAFIVFTIVYNLISNIVSVGKIVDIADAALDDMAFSFDFNSFMGMTLVPTLILDLIFAVAYFVLTNYFLKKKLNLE